MHAPKKVPDPLPGLRYIERYFPLSALVRSSSPSALHVMGDLVGCFDLCGQSLLLLGDFSDQVAEFFRTTEHDRPNLGRIGGEAAECEVVEPVEGGNRVGVIHIQGSSIEAADWSSR